MLDSHLRPLLPGRRLACPGPTRGRASACRWPARSSSSTAAGSTPRASWARAPGSSSSSEGRRPLRRGRPRPPGQADQPVVLKKRATDAGRAPGPGHRHRLPQAPARGPGTHGDPDTSDEAARQKHDYHLLVVIDDNPEVLKLMKLLLERRVRPRLRHLGRGGPGPPPGPSARPRPQRRHDARDGRPAALPADQGATSPQAHPRSSW